MLEVKTLGPSRHDPDYDWTWAFYTGIGFVPIGELWIWGPDNPALILCKPLMSKPQQPRWCSTLRGGRCAIYLSMVIKDEMFAAIVVQRHQLADMLDGLSDDEWNTASLCAGWRARDVVGHLLSILEVPIGRFVLNVIKAWSFDKYSDRVAREIGTRDPKSLVAGYRAMADKRFAPPIVGPIAPLTDVFVHTRDVERPIGRQSHLDDDGLRTVLDYVCGGRARGFVPPSRTKGLRFEATDLGWSMGDGPVVSGAGEAIMMAVASRRSAFAELSGEGAMVLRQRVS